MFNTIPTSVCDVCVFGHYNLPVISNVYCIHVLYNVYLCDAKTLTKIQQWLD